MEKYINNNDLFRKTLLAEITKIKKKRFRSKY